MSCQFITFEGVEGAGKTTQLNLCADWLRSLGHRVRITREPGGTELGQGIRQLFLGSTGLDDRAELMLLMADRAQHVQEFIKPSLGEGFVVLCDRYSDSTFAYQGYGRGMDWQLISSLNQIATAGLEPDLTLWLDLDVDLGLTRARQQSQQQAMSGDRIEQEKIEFHRQVGRGFRNLSKQYPQRIKRINATTDIVAVHAQIRRVVTACLDQMSLKT
ncbi:thymidylate kinase [Thalassoporum mexicanum PCC 7367]|uniref:dTMP kinase n=1 Tax=Thalassoporum mexicanum TaxID=3457544 RepID=UPI00029FBFC2|nr:dTMP kinase [Pseudanabaena sp. PCC 7367]AFY70406.1 thymidylate kinase [Pseudanabaena sp. PCC 7367]